MLHSILYGTLNLAGNPDQIPPDLHYPPSDHFLACPIMEITKVLHAKVLTNRF